MREIASIAICLTLVGCGGSGAVGGVSETVKTQTEVLNETFEDNSTALNDRNETLASAVGDSSFGNILNNVRLDVGAGSVRYDARLDGAAQAHADDMINRNYFAHVSPEGENAHDRILAQGYNPKAWGENLASGQRTEQEALEGWQNSPSHNKMMTSTNLEDFGLGHTANGSDTRWVLVMGTEAD